MAWHIKRCDQKTWSTRAARAKYGMSGILLVAAKHSRRRKKKMKRIVDSKVGKPGEAGVLLQALVENAAPSKCRRAWLNEAQVGRLTMNQKHYSWTHAHKVEYEHAQTPRRRKHRNNALQNNKTSDLRNHRRRILKQLYGVQRLPVGPVSDGKSLIRNHGLHSSLNFQGSDEKRHENFYPPTRWRTRKSSMFCVPRTTQTRTTTTKTTKK